MKSLHASGHILAHADKQVEILENDPQRKFPLYKDKLEKSGLYPLKPTGIEIFQVNIGKMCNQTCRHCHVDAGPDRKEIMTKETMQLCLDVLKKNPTLTTIDITGG